MNRQDLFEKLDHDLLSAIRNFQVAAQLLAGKPTELAVGTELLLASIEQLEGARAFLQKSNQVLKENNQSTAAQK